MKLHDFEIGDTVTVIEDQGVFNKGDVRRVLDCRDDVPLLNIEAEGSDIGRIIRYQSIRAANEQEKVGYARAKAAIKALRVPPEMFSSLEEWKAYKSFIRMNVPCLKGYVV